MSHLLNDGGSAAAPATPRAVRLADYAVPDFLVETADLAFELDATATTVHAAWGCGAIRPRAILPRLVAQCPPQPGVDGGPSPAMTCRAGRAASAVPAVPRRR